MEDIKESNPRIHVVDNQICCRSCGASLAGDRRWEQIKVCSNCGHHERLTAKERVALLLDDGSFVETNPRMVSGDPLQFSDVQPYRDRVHAAQKKTGLNEAVLTGTGSIRNLKVVIAIVDFNFLGGSMGSVAGEKIALAFENAIDLELPIVTVVASGGARMQEGMLSLVQMAKTAAAARRAHMKRVPYISVLTDPTTGGMYASFATQGDIILAEPNALIGFAGPRVIAGTMPNITDPSEIPSHTAEYLLEEGFLDAIVERWRLRDTLATILRVFSRAQQEVWPTALPAVDNKRRDLGEAWDVVQVARRDDRPTALDYIRRMSRQFVELHGDRVFGDDAAVVTGLGELGGRGVIFIGLERGHHDPIRRGGQALPEGYRKAHRMMLLARRFRCPLITLVDTPGAYLGIESEERGLAHALSECLAEMSMLPVPVVSVIIGEGGSGGALALGVADRILMQEHAIYSVIAPEGAAAILFRDPERAPEVAESLKLTAQDCVELGVVDNLVAEPELGAHNNAEFAATLLRDALLWALGDLQDTKGSKLIEDRYRKFRKMGDWSELPGQEGRAHASRFARRVGSLLDRMQRQSDTDRQVEIAEPAS